MSARSGAPVVVLAAADVSGDRSAGSLARAISALAPQVRLLGAGGPAMRAAGVDVAVKTTDLSFVGILDAVRVLPELRRCYRCTQRLVEESRPDLVVLCDAETVTVPLAWWLKRRGVAVAFFFPPQVWLWGAWRLPLIAPLARRFISAFREEAELYRSAGADAVWTGHPLRDVVRPSDDSRTALEEVGLDPERPLVVLMPGSRRSEIHALAPAFLGAAALLQARDSRLQFALPLAADSLRGEVEAAVRASAVPDVKIYRPTSYAVAGAARAVLQCSGTATLETGLLGVPSVIAYRCRPIEYIVGRHLLIDAPFIGMPNILLGEMVQPEFFQKNVDAEHLAAALWTLLRDEVRREIIRTHLARLPELLGCGGALQRAAEAVLDLVREDRSSPPGAPGC